MSLVVSAKAAASKCITGDGVLAEQMGSSTSGEVYWNHEDLLTGSYSKVTRSGSLLSGSPPRSAELEPLGGAIPQGDPNIYDDLAVPSGLRQFKFAGDVNRPDFGCEYNGGPVPCNLLSELIRGRDVMIGVRYQGDEGGAWGLRQSISTSIWRYNVRLVVNNEDKRLTAAMYKDKELLKDLPHGKVGLLIGTVFAVYNSPFAELVISHVTMHAGINPIFIHRLDNDAEKALAKRILDIVYYARDSKECTEAFKAAGATPIGEQILNTTIVTENAFSMENDDINWTRGSDIGKKMRAGLKNHPTTNDLSWPGIYENTGWRFIGLTNRAIEEKDDHLSVTVIHSFIHSGDVQGQDTSTWWQRNISGNVPHDLKFLDEKYKTILKHCTREKGSKALWGQ